MQAWGIFATILFFAFAGLSGYLYYERDNLLSEKEKLTTEKEQATNKLNDVSEDLQVLDEFVTKEFAASSSEGTSDLSSQIETLESRNVSVAYENYSKASSKDKLAAAQVFFSEFLGLLLEGVGAEKTEDEDRQQDKSTKDTEQLEGEGEYSENIFP